MPAAPVADLTLAQSAVLTVIDALPDGTVVDAGTDVSRGPARRARAAPGCRPVTREAE
jgi:hypothetical protein